MNTWESGHGSQDGYTLVEMLVVLGLISIVALLASGGMQFAGRVQHATAEEIRNVRDVASVQRGLRTLIANAVPPMSGEGETMGAAGTQSEFRFQSDPRGSAGLVGRHIVTVQILGEPRASRIRIQAKPVGQFSKPVQETFGPFPAGLKVAYGTVQDEGLVSLTHEWPHADRLPALFRISTSGVENDWPDLIVALGRNEPPGCRYDPVSQGCR